MKNRSQYMSNVGYLIGCYVSGRIEHRNCYACAVGNLVALGLGISLKKAPRFDQEDIYWYWGSVDEEVDIWKKRPVWQEVFLGGMMFSQPIKEIPGAEEQIKGTGYTTRQLMLIDLAFESVIPSDVDYYSLKYHEKRKYLYKGVNAVLEVLKKIHEVSDRDHERTLKYYNFRQLLPR